MQHTGRLTGLSGQLGQRVRTNSEQLLALTRTHGEWEKDPEKIRLTPGSVSITSGVWPDPVTSIEPVYWGPGSDLFAYLVNEHRDGKQKHPTTSFIKDLVEHPGRVLAFDDARRWSERTVIMLCSQTTDTSIELYWDEERLRSRHGDGAAPAVHIPAVEKFVGRLAEKMGSRQGALLFEIINRGASAHFVGGTPIGDSSDSGAVDPYLRLFGQPGLHVMDGSVMPAEPGGEPVTDDHRSGRAGDVALAEPGRAGHQAAPGLRLRAHQSGPAASARRTRRRSGGGGRAMGRCGRRSSRRPARR